MCRFYGVSTSGFYAFANREKIPRQQEDEHLLRLIESIHEDSLESYGSPRVTGALKNMGKKVGENRVARLMRENGIEARAQKLYYANPGVHAFFTQVPNRIRKIELTGADQIWVGDVTYVRVGRKWHYLAVVMDLYSRRIVGWSLSSKRNVDLTLKALNNAVRNRRPAEGLVFHSDRGIEYAGKRYKKRLKALGFTQSMNRPGKMTDNIFIESFFHSFKTDVYHGWEFETEQQMRSTLNFYMPYYNFERLHSSLDYQAPADFERMAA